MPLPVWAQNCLKDSGMNQRVADCASSNRLSSASAHTCNSPGAASQVGPLCQGMPREGCYETGEEGGMLARNTARQVRLTKLRTEENGTPLNALSHTPSLTWQLARMEGGREGRAAPKQEGARNHISSPACALVLSTDTTTPCLEPLVRQEEQARLRRREHPVNITCTFSGSSVATCRGGPA